jgi:hypothetical protein
MTSSAPIQALQDATRRVFFLRWETSFCDALALLRELEISLERSQRVLLSGDADALAVETAAQRRILTKLDALGKQDADAGRAGDSEICDTADSYPAKLHASAERVLHRGRVQQALLSRAGQRLRLISNLLAGPQLAYAAAAMQHSHATSAIVSVRGDKTPCRA